MNEKTSKGYGYPPGRIKIMKALKSLLSEKDFNAIKIAEIAETAGVNEALIYKYFKNKRDLMYQMVTDYLECCREDMIEEIERREGAFRKLEKFICTLFNIYNRDKIYSKMILFEFRNSSDYYSSKPYKILQDNYDLCLHIINEGIREGQIRDDVNPSVMRQLIIGSVEQFCMNAIISERDLSPERMTERTCKLLFHGISKKEDS